jgi:hypothetical protein
LWGSLRKTFKKPQESSIKTNTFKFSVMGKRRGKGGRKVRGGAEQKRRTR